MNKGIWIVIPFIIIAAFAILYAVNKHPNIPGTFLEESITPTVTIAPTIQTSLIYENSKYGFTLNLPLTWQNYKVTTYEGKNPQDRSICFSFEKTSSNSLPICVLQLNIFTQTEWAGMAKKPTLITQNNKYVFAWSYNGDCVQADAFQCDRIKETPSIISTFTLK